MKNKDHAYWIADKIPACGEYAAEASLLLRKQADKIEELEQQLAAEREACAKICENTSQEYEPYVGTPRMLNYTCADAIRARGRP